MVYDFKMIVIKLIIFTLTVFFLDLFSINKSTKKCRASHDKQVIVADKGEQRGVIAIL